MQGVHGIPSTEYAEGWSPERASRPLSKVEFERASVSIGCAVILLIVASCLVLYLDWYLVSATVLLAVPVYVIVAKHRAIPQTESWITIVTVALLVVCGGVSGLLLALGMVPATGFSYALIVLVSLLSAGSVCLVLIKYENLILSVFCRTSCRIGLAIGLTASFAVAWFFIPKYVEGSIELLLHHDSSADRRKDRKSVV